MTHVLNLSPCHSMSSLFSIDSSLDLRLGWLNLLEILWCDDTILIYDVCQILSINLKVSVRYCQLNKNLLKSSIVEFGTKDSFSRLENLPSYVTLYVDYETVDRIEI